MYRPGVFAATVSLLLAAALLASPVAVAHGETDEEKLAAFQHHIDDYEAEIAQLVAAVDAIVAEHASGAPGDGRVDALIEQWEAVAVHEAIEYKATLAYPGIWQGIVGLKQAVETGKAAETVAAAGEQLKAALWQGLGALKLAASQTGA